MKYVYNTLAYVPLLWLLFVSMTIANGYLALGHLPQYGIDPAPHALDIRPNTILSMTISVACTISLITWPILFSIDALRYRKSFRVNIPATTSFLLGLTSISLLCFHLTPLFDWYLD